jgi:hypothetical protein
MLSITLSVSLVTIIFIGLLKLHPTPFAKDPVVTAYGFSSGVALHSTVLIQTVHYVSELDAKRPARGTKCARDCFCASR